MFYHGNLKYYGVKIRLHFTKSFLKQPKFTFTHKNIVNNYIFYELAASSSNSSDPTIKNCLFGAVTLTKKCRHWKIQIFWLWNWI